MISFPLLKKEMTSHIKLLVIFIAVLTMYFSVIIYMYDPELGKLLDQFSEALPEMMAAVGMSSSGGTLLEFISNYLYGFFMLMFPMIFEIILANGLVVKYVDSGSMACILASPNTRKKIISTQILVMALHLFILIGYVTILGIVCSELMFPGELDIPKFLLLNGAVFILHVAVSSIAFFASCIFNESKMSIMLGAGLPFIFYLIQMMANMGGKLENLKYATIFTLFPASKITTGESGILGSCMILLAIGIVLYTAGAWIFTKRDLPL